MMEARTGWGRIAVGIAVLGIAACGPLGRHAEFATAGFTSADYGYEIGYVPGTKAVLRPAWRLDNYRQSSMGLVPKDRGLYMTRYDFDTNSDGRADDWVNGYTYALRYEHNVHAGTIWLRAIPISATLRDKDLRVLMQDFIDEITTATYETVKLHEAGVTPVVIEHRETAAIVEQGLAQVAARPAYAAVIDLANVDQLRINPGLRTRRIELVLLRAPKDEVTSTRRNRYPVVLLAGYSNMPADFALGLDDFHDLLRRMTIAGQSGLTLQLAPVGGAPVVAPAPAAAPAAAPAPAAAAAPAPAPAPSAH